MSSRKSEAAFLTALLLALALVQSVHLTRPFLRQHESVGAELGKHARNHLKFGLSKTFGLKLDVSGPSLDPYPDHRRYYYANHPPLPVLVLAGSFALFGVSEASFRITFILFSLSAVLLFHAVARRLVPAPCDRAATLIFAFLPSFAYYSIVTGLQVMGLVGTLSAVLCYLRWRDGGRRPDLAGLLLSILFACYCSWSGYYIALALAAAHVRSGQGRTGTVLALIPWNGAVFGLYLLQLWAASPPDLDPIRKLFTAAVSRSALQDRSLLGYLSGECRELALLMTVPALGLAAAWLATLFRRGLTRDDRVILGLALLGLDEFVFRSLAAGHEYFSYPLVVFFALAAASGLARIGSWLQARRPAPALPLVPALLGLCLLQSGWMLHRRLSTEGAYEFYHRLGLALRDAVPPDARVLLLTDSIPFYTPFYGDRYCEWYDAPRQELVPENSGGRRTGVSEADVLGLLRENPGRFDVAVTAEKGTLVPRVAFFRTLTDAQLEAFGVETRRTARRDLLEQRCGPPRELGGFHFWKLR